MRKQNDLSSLWLKLSNIQEIYGTILIIKIRGYIYQTDNMVNYNQTMSKRSVQDINKFHFKAGSGELASIHIYRGHYCCVWSVRLFFPSLICSYWAWGNMASHAYNNPISVSHIPNLLPPFFLLWCTHRNCPLFHCPLKIEAPTLHVILVHI